MWVYITYSHTKNQNVYTPDTPNTPSTICIQSPQNLIIRKEPYSHAKTHMYAHLTHPTHLVPYVYIRLVGSLKREV